MEINDVMYVEELANLLEDKKREYHRKTAIYNMREHIIMNRHFVQTGPNQISSNQFSKVDSESPEAKYVMDNLYLEEELDLLELEIETLEEMAREE